MSPSQTPDELHMQPESVLVYPPAYEMLRPFFARQAQWGSGSLEHLALRTLKDHFPEYSAQERFLIVITARQLFRNGRGLL